MTNKLSSVNIELNDSSGNNVQAQQEAYNRDLENFALDQLKK